MSKRTILHIVLGVLMWAVFGYYWSLVVQRPLNPHTRVALATVAVIVAVLTLFLAGWVIHNIRIARRYARRRTRRAGGGDPETDFLGRPLIFRDTGALKSAAYIEIHVVETSGGAESDAEAESVRPHAEQKVFRIPDLPPPPHRNAAGGPVGAKGTP